MESTHYFILGMATTIMTAVAVMCVWNVVKTHKLTKFLKIQEERIDNAERNLWTTLSEHERRSQQDLSQLERSIDSRFEYVHRGMETLQTSKKILKD